jgi:hypothetical protein
MTGAGVSRSAFGPPGVGPASYWQDYNAIMPDRARNILTVVQDNPADSRRLNGLSCGYGIEGAPACAPARQIS